MRLNGSQRLLDLSNIGWRGYLKSLLVSRTGERTSPALSICSSEVLWGLLSSMTRFERMGKSVRLCPSGGGRAAGGGKFVGRVITGRTWPSTPAITSHKPLAVIISFMQQKSL